MFKKWLIFTLLIFLLISSISSYAYYTYTQQSGENYFVGTGDKADALEDTCEVRMILDAFGTLLGHSKYNTTYPADGDTSVGTLQIPEASLKFGNDPANGDIAAYIGDEMMWQTKEELGIDLSLYYLKTEIDTQSKMEAIWGVNLATDTELSALTYSDVGAQQADDALTSISGLTYVEDSLIKLTAEDTYTVRTLSEVKEDLDVDDLESIVNALDSPCIVTGGAITEGSDPGTFKVEEITAAFLRTSASATAPLVSVTLAEQDNQTITAADTTYHVILNYGTPCTITTSETAPNGYNAIPIGKVMKDGSDNVSYLSNGFRFGDGIRKFHRRAELLREIDLQSGSAISYSGTNNFTMTAGVAFSGINEISLSSYDSATTQFTYVYSDGAGGWTETPSNVIDYEHYDDGDGTLGNVGVSKYGVHYVYRHVSDGSVYVVYGTDSYSLAEAEVAAIIPPTVPDHLADFGCQIGAIIAPQSGGTFTAVIMVTSQFFSGTEVVNHNNLGGLQGGAADEYYHLTEAQHTIATQPADTDNSGYLLTADWDTFNNKIANLIEDTTPEYGGAMDHNNERDTEVKTIEFNGLYDNGNSGATPTIDWQNGNYQKIAISENALLSFSNVFVGTITLVINYSGDYTVGFNAGYTILEEGGVEVSFTETNGAMDILKVMYLGTADNYVVGLMTDVKD